MDTLEILIAGRAEVEKGWIKFDSENRYGVCALGGLWRVAGGAAVLASSAVEVLKEALPCHWTSVSAFNDDHRTTKADVLALYQRAIDAELAKVTADTAHTFATVS